MIIDKVLPSIYDENREMKALNNSEAYEFEHVLETSIRSSFENNFIKTADSQGLAEFEKLVDITAKPTEDLDFRRQRLWDRINSNALYTERYLETVLNAYIGEGNWVFEKDYNNYALNIRVLKPGNDWFNELINVLKKILPCNLDWTIELFAIRWQEVYENIETWQDLYEMNITWQELMEGEWLDNE